MIRHISLIGAHDLLGFLLHLLFTPLDLSPQLRQFFGGVVVHRTISDLPADLLPHIPRLIQILLVKGNRIVVHLPPAQIIFQTPDRNQNTLYALQLIRRKAVSLLCGHHDLLDLIHILQRRRSQLFDHLPAVCGVPQLLFQLSLRQYKSRLRDPLFCPLRYRKL